MTAQVVVVVGRRDDDSMEKARKQGRCDDGALEKKNEENGDGAMNRTASIECEKWDTSIPLQTTKEKTVHNRALNPCSPPLIKIKSSEFSSRTI